MNLKKGQLEMIGERHAFALGSMHKDCLAIGHEKGSRLSYPENNSKDS